MKPTPATVLLLFAVSFVQQREVRAPDDRDRSAPRPVDPSRPEPRHPLDPDDFAAFERGRATFERRFHRRAGLGAPDMNADSCLACHRDPGPGGAGALELNVSLFARDHGGAGPFEDLPGGPTLARLRPPFAERREEQPVEADVFEQRQPPSLLGAGLIESIPAAAILAHEDALDADGDGIRGAARRVVAGGRFELGRFGWKAQAPSLLDFVREELGTELGLTSADGGRGFGLAVDADAAPDPELDPASVEELALFVSQLAAPERAGSLAPEVLLGELVFDEVGCAKCHVPELRGADGPVKLYSDLLLHDVSPRDFRGMSEPGAPAGTYRTPPLWGIRATAPYMHDGRAATLRDAIALHAGEAHAVRKSFEARPRAEQEALLAFLRDL